MLNKENFYCNKERMGARTPFYFYLAMLMLMMASFLSNSHVNAAFNVTFQFHVPAGFFCPMYMENVRIARNTNNQGWFITFFNSRSFSIVLAGGYSTLRNISMPDDDGEYYVSMHSWTPCPISPIHSCESTLLFNSSIAGKVVRFTLVINSFGSQGCNYSIVVI